MREEATDSFVRVHVTVPEHGVDLVVGEIGDNLIQICTTFLDHAGIVVPATPCHLPLSSSAAVEPMKFWGLKVRSLGQVQMIPETWASEKPWLASEKGED